MSIEVNKAIVRAFAKAVNQKNWRRVDELVAPDFVRHSFAAPPVNGREELKEFLRSEFDVFPDAREVIEDIVAENDRVAVRYRFTGTQEGQMDSHPPSGKSMSIDYIVIYRIAGGVIAESWAEWDNLSGLRQLGHAEEG